MNKKIEFILKQIDDIYRDYKNWSEINSNPVDYDLKYLFSHYTAISDAILRFSPKGSYYYINFEEIIHEYNSLDLKELLEVTELLSELLYGLKNAYSNGYFDTIEQEINFGIFTDFLEMAEQFLDYGDQYIHPGAFLIGGVLEEHLRKLAIKNDIIIYKENEKFRKAEELNTELRNKGVYDLNEQKSITSWLGLRNDADHAHWDNYSKEKVEVMLKDVKRIIKQYPA